MERKHDLPGVPLISSASRIVYPPSLEDLKAIIERIKASLG